MVADRADGVLGAVARVNTLLVTAGQGRVAVWVAEALWPDTLSQRVAKVLGQTRAFGLVVPH